MTPGERMVWAAVYAATWSRMSTVAERSRWNWTQEQTAVESANEAGYAVTALRRLADSAPLKPYLAGLSVEARDIIDGDKP